MEATTTTRADHMRWCKSRALAYLPLDPDQAFASMVSDLGKHDQTRGHIGIEMGTMMLMGGHLNTPEKMRSWIEGFN